MKKGVRWHDKPVSKNMTADFGVKLNCQNGTLIILVAATDIIFRKISRKNRVKIFLVAATKKFSVVLYLVTFVWYNRVNEKNMTRRAQDGT